MSPDDSTRFNILEFCIRRHGWRRGATEDASKCNARQGFDMSNFLLRKDSQRIFPYVKPTRPDHTNQDSSTGMSHIELEQWLRLEGEIIPYYIDAFGSSSSSPLVFLPVLIRIRSCPNKKKELVVRS